jgi:hypothetical protein
VSPGAVVVVSATVVVVESVGELAPIGVASTTINVATMVRARPLRSE